MRCMNWWAAMRGERAYLHARRVEAGQAERLCHEQLVAVVALRKAQLPAARLHALQVLLPGITLLQRKHLVPLNGAHIAARVDAPDEQADGPGVVLNAGRREVLDRERVDGVRD